MVIVSCRAASSLLGQPLWGAGQSSVCWSWSTQAARTPSQRKREAFTGAKGERKSNLSAWRCGQETVKRPLDALAAKTTTMRVPRLDRVQMWSN